MRYKNLGNDFYEPIKILIFTLILNFPTIGFSASDPNQVHTEEIEGRMAVALKYWQASLEHLKQADKTPVLLQIAKTYLALGQIQEALGYLETADTISAKHGDQSIRLQVLTLYSDVYLLSRNVDQALKYARQGVALASTLVLASKLKDNKPLATAMIQLGNVQMAMQHYKPALVTYQEAIKRLEPLDDNVLSSKLRINAIHALLAMKFYDKAVPLLSQSLKILLKREDSYDKAIDLIAIGYLCQQIIDQQQEYLSQLQEPAYQVYTAALNIGNTIKNNRILSYAYGHLGELYSSADKLPDAEILLRQGLFLAIQEQMPELSARWYWQLGRIKRKQNQQNQAIVFYQKAVSDLESVESALIYGYRGKPTAFRDTIGIIYLELAELLLQQSAQTKTSADEQRALNQVKQVMEQFKTFELKNYFQDDCVTELQNKLVSTDVEGLLGAKTATLYPIVLPDRLVILLSLKNGLTKRFEAFVASSQLKQNVLAFRELLLQPGNPRRLRNQGLKLYDWLIKPVEKTLQDHAIDTLVIVPDDILRAIPYSALFDGQDFLVTKYALAITPGLSLTNRVNSSKTNKTILLAGLSEAVQNFSSLPFVTQEIANISTTYDNYNVLLNQDFKKNDVKQQLSNKPYGMVVFSTHAYLAPDPKESFLLTYDSKIDLDELEQYIQKTGFHDQPLDLLVLSACDTAEGDERALLGLAGIAVKSGANSVLASLWPVHDASTSELIPAFFEQLKQKNMSKAKALQLAQKQLLTSQRYRHPFYWAGFVMIGEWR